MGNFCIADDFCKEFEVEIMPRCFVALTMFLRLACFGECTGISFVDSTCIPVIHNKREFNMKVFKGIAAFQQSRKSISITRCLSRMDSS